jgi:hypothetical protein
MKKRNSNNKGEFSGKLSQLLNKENKKILLSIINELERDVYSAEFLEPVDVKGI